MLALERFDCPLTLQEIYDTIDTMNYGKAPGPAEVTIEWNKFFKMEITPIPLGIFFRCLMKNKPCYFHRMKLESL